MKHINLFKPLKFSLFLLLMVLLMNSCYKERFGADKIAGGTWNPELAAPIAYADMDMSYMIRNSSETWKEYPDGLLSLVYEEKGVSDFADKIITIPDQQADTNLNIILPPVMNPGDSTFKYFVFSAVFNSNNNERVDSILIKSGTMTLEVTTDLNHDGYIEVTIPSMTKYGVTFRQKVEIKYTGGSSTTASVTVPVFDYYLKLDHNANNQNFLKQYIKVSVTKGANPDNSPYHFEVKQQIKDIEYYVAIGYFGKHTFSIPVTEVPISLFESQVASSVFIQDPHLYVTLHNSYGLPSNITFTKLYAERDGVIKNITSSILPTLPVNYPKLSDIGTTDTTIFHFYDANSNIVDVVEMNPEKIVFEGVVETNPSGVPVPNFVLDTSHISVDVTMELPLYGRAMEFELRDTSDIDTANNPNIDQVKSVQLNVITDNEFPVDANLQLYFADSNGVAFDSVFSTGRQLLKSAPVGAAPDYRTTGKSHNITKVPLNEHQIDSYIKAKKLLISAEISTFDQGTKVVKIYSDYSLYVEVSAKVEVEQDF